MSSIGVVLAGGRSSRMGQDKASLIRLQQNMLDFSQSLLQQVALDKVVISGANAGGVPDLYEQAGPLGGIYSVLNKYNATELLIIPVDMPFMTADALAQLLKVGRVSQKPAHYQQHPLPLYLPINAVVEQHLKTEFSHFNGRGPSFKGLLSHCKAITIKPENPALITNTNTPGEWQTAIGQLSQKRSTHVKSRLN